MLQSPPDLITTATANLASVMTPAENAPVLLTVPLLDQARAHGVEPLIYRTLQASNRLPRQLPEIRDRLVRAAREAALVEPFRRADLLRLLQRLADRGIRPLLFKGTPLAYTHYPEPWLRPRLDTDLIVREDEAAAASSVLEAAGLTRVNRPAGEHVSHQASFFGSPDGIRLVYDVHWKIADPQVFAEVFGYEELAREATTIGALGGEARGIGDVHALVLACIHRVAHHYDADTLIFLYDIDLLARRLDRASWARVAAIAARKRMAGICGRGLELARHCFGTPVPPAVMSALTRAAGEPSTRYLRARLTKVDILRSDLETLSGWGPR